MSKFNFLRYALLVAISASALTTDALAQSAFDDPGARSATGVAGDLKAVNDKVDSGDVVVGTTSQVVVLLRNEDNKPLKTGAINLYPSSNITAAIGENQCAASAIQPGEVCAISVQVKGLQVGKYRIEMLVRHEGRTKLLTTAINGNVSSSGDKNADIVSDLEMVPTEIDFGSLTESSSQARAVIMRNKTSKPLEIESVTVEGGLQSGYSVNSNCKTLATGAACVASVMWNPQRKGKSSGTLIIKHDGATEVSTVDLEGQYDPTESAVAEVFPEAVPGKGLLISSREDVDFGSGVAQSSSITTSLVNVGDMPLTITDIRMANAENGVRMEKAGCVSGAVLAPLDACPLTMTWEPVREGNIVDDIQVSHTGARGILVLPIRGAAARAINKDAKAITLGGSPDAVIRNIRPLSMEDLGEEGEDVALDEDAVSETGGETGEGKTSASKKSAKTPKKPSESSMAALEEYASPVDVRGVLDGYVITSFSPKRAIVAGPGGSRVVFNGEQTVIGGILWEITMRPSAIEFKNGKQKVLLLFDKSLSSFNILDAQSSSGNASLNNSSSSSSTSSSSATTTQ